MSLFFDLRVTDGPTPSSLGLLEVQRITNTDVAEPTPHMICRYAVRLDGTQCGVVEHVYGDGPWTLAAKATACAADWRSVIPG